MAGLECYHAQVSLLTAYASSVAIGELYSIADTLRGSSQEELVADVVLVCEGGINQDELMDVAQELAISRIGEVDSPLAEASVRLLGSIESLAKIYMPHCKVCPTCNTMRIFLDLTDEDESPESYFTLENYLYLMADIQGECDDILPSIQGIVEGLVLGKLDLNDPVVIVLLNHLMDECFFCSTEIIKELRNAIERYK